MELDGVFFDWPGLGDEPARTDVGNIDDLVTIVLDRMNEPVNIVAQSMGGLVAIGCTSKDSPSRIDSHLRWRACCGPWWIGLAF